MTHTPGPWILDAPAYRGVTDETYHYITSVPPDRFTRPALEISGFLSAADAQLLRTAPDLLEVAKLALSAEPPEDLRALRAAAYAALVAATGE